MSCPSVWKGTVLTSLLHVTIKRKKMLKINILSLLCATLKFSWQKFICGFFFTSFTKESKLLGKASEKIYKSNFQVKISVYRTYYFFLDVWENTMSYMCKLLFISWDIYSKISMSSSVILIIIVVSDD